MEIRQQKHSNKIRFAFGEEALDYSLEDSSGSRSYSVPYTDISRDRQTLVERNQWLGHVGLLWLLLGAGLTAFSFLGVGGRKSVVEGKSVSVRVDLGCRR